MGKEKRCNACGQLKPLDEFCEAPGCVDGHRGDCRACFQGEGRGAGEAQPELRERARERTRRWIEDNDERYREYKRAYGKVDKKKQADRRAHLRNKFGTGPDDYDQMPGEQGGGCAVCGDPPGDTALHVDHDHETGAVRGLLCFWCNSALGNLRDDPDIIASALAYVTRHAGGSR